jgi:hypothetical protein
MFTEYIAASGATRGRFVSRLRCALTEGRFARHGLRHEAGATCRLGMHPKGSFVVRVSGICTAGAPGLRSYPNLTLSLLFRRFDSRPLRRLLDDQAP